MKRIAILGKPNVGKSSLFNCFLKQRKAITSDVAGTTRDVNSSIMDFNGNLVEVLDTGGIDESSELFSKVKELSIKASEQADLVLYMVDGKLLPQEEDRALFYAISKKAKNCILVINKIDNDKEKQRGWEFARFGAKESFMI